MSELRGKSQDRPLNLTKRKTVQRGLEAVHRRGWVSLVPSVPIRKAKSCFLGKEVAL